MTASIKQTALAVLATAMGLGVATAQAGDIGLDSDGTAILSGTRNFVFDDFGFPFAFPMDAGDTVAVVDYAVYGPTTNFATTALGVDPRGAFTDHYLYAYQVEFLGSTSSTASSILSSLSVGLDDLILNSGKGAFPTFPALLDENDNPLTDTTDEFERVGVTGDIDTGDTPATATFVTKSGGQVDGSFIERQNVLWEFEDSGPDAFNLNEFSNVLYFSSAEPPEFDSATLGYSDGQATQGLPSPAPEPTSVALMMGGLMALAGRRRRLRR